MSKFEGPWRTREMEGLTGALTVIAQENNLPFDAQRLQREIRMVSGMEQVVTSILHFERGRRLNEMWPRLQGPECRTFTAFMEQWFPEIHRQNAYVDMKFARMAANLPNFRGLANMKGGWGKVELLMQFNPTPEEMQEFEELGTFRGIDVVKETRESVKKELKQTKRANEALSQENEDLRRQVKGLEAEVGAGETASDKALKQILGANDRLFDGIRLLNKVDMAALTADQTVRGQMIGVCEHVIYMLEGLRTDATLSGAVEGADGL